MNSNEIKDEPIPSKYIISNENYMSKIKNMLLAIINQLNSNNVLKTTLVNLKDFDKKAFFDELDTLQKGYLNSVDIFNFLKKFTLNFSEQIIRRLIQHYDKKTPYKLYFEDFNALITPNTQINEENKNNIKGNRDEIFLKVLKNEFKLIVKYHEMIVDIKKCDNFITYEAFISISEEEKNIDNEKLKKFLGIEDKDEDSKRLLYYLDMDNDGLLTYDEFEDFFASMPVSQEDINYMNNEEIKYALKSKENTLKERNMKNNVIKNDNNIINKEKKEENISIKNNVLIQNKVIYEKNISKITEFKTKEIKYNIKNINNTNNINNNSLSVENEENNINDNINENKQELPKRNNKIVKKINYNVKNLLKNDKEIIEYETYLKNRYSSEEMNENNNIFNNNNKIKNYEKIVNKKEENNENNFVEQNNDDDFDNKNINQKKIIINKYEIQNRKEKNINNNKKYEIQNRKENDINNNKKYEIQIQSNIINNNREFYYYNSPNDENNEDNIKENNINEENQFSSSYKIIENSINNKKNIENINTKNNKNNINNNNDINNLFSDDNFSGNLSSTDFNKSDNFISENNIENNLQKKNEIEYRIENENKMEYNQNNNKKININQNRKKNINNKFNIESENLQYIQNKYKDNSNDEIKEEDLYIQKNTDIEIKNDNNLKEIDKNKISSKNEIKTETNNIIKMNIKNENYNKLEISNNINNNNTNENSNPNPNPINVNGSLFTCGGNLEQEKITLKPGVQEIENEEYKYKLSSIQTNNDLVTQIKSEYKMESPFSNINKNLNDVFSKEVFIKNKKDKESDYLNSNNKYFYFQDKIQKEENQKIDFNKKGKNIKNKNENIYINKINNEESKSNIKNLNVNKAFKEQINEEREDFVGDFSENKYKYTNEKYIFENNNLKKNLQYINNTNNYNNIFSNEKITQKSDSSDLDDYNPNNEQTIHDLSNIININSNEYNFSSKTSINIFLDYIDNILKLESTCLILKESLALREDITFKELFCLFDYHKNKNISIHEFKKVCKNTFGLYPTTDQVRLIFNRYDINKDEKLDLKEFLNMICPIKKEYLSILFGDKRIQKPFKTELSEKSKKIIENLTKSIILNETNYYEIREKMKNNNFDKNEVWNILLQFAKNKNYLNKKNFDKFLKSHSYYLTSYEIDIIFNKFDFDKDAHINLDDFKHEFIV